MTVPGLRQHLQGRFVELIQLFPPGASTKNGADIRLCLDATEDIARHAARLLIAQLRSDAYDDAPAPLHNQGFVPQLVVRGSTAPMRPAAARPLPSDPS